MGQTVLEPPSVFGWNWEEAWISSVGLLARYEFVRDTVTSRFSKAFKPEKLIDVELTGAALVDAVIEQLGLGGALGANSQFTANQRQDLIDYVNDNTVDDPDAKVRGLYGLVLQSAASVLH
jgi:hypothetical protein